MPQLIPSVPVEEISPYSEQTVVAALLAQLPDDCRIYHNYEFLTKGGGATGKALQEGEIDAVILWPDKGLLVLEIKGGQISYCAHKAIWTTSNRHGTATIKDPISQARGNMHALIKAIEKQLNKKLNGSLTHGFAVIFPTSRSEGDLPHSIDTAIICDATDLRLLADL